MSSIGKKLTHPLAFLTAFALVSCQPAESAAVSSDSFQSQPGSQASDVLTDEESGGSQTSDVSTDEESGLKDYALFSHQFTASEIQTSAGTVEAEGIEFDYSDASFIGAVANQSGRDFGGIQIGSAKNPQKTPWTLTASLPAGTYVTSYKLEVATASNGSGTYSVSFGDYEKSGDFVYAGTASEYDTFSESGLEVSSESFTLSLTSTADKALYLVSLEIGLGSDVEGGLDGIGQSTSAPEKPDADPDPTPDPEPDPTPDPEPDPSVPAGEIKPGQGQIPATVYDPVSADEYYKNVDLTLTADALEDELHSLISNMKQYSYDDARYTLIYTDESIDNPGYLYSALDGDILPAKWDSGQSWNREHTWPQSQLEGVSGAKSDLHNLRASCPAANGKHGNTPYGEEGTDYFYPNVTSGLKGSHEYTGDFRGDVARICFYMQIRYPSLELKDNPSQSAGADEYGDLSTLLEWNREDPVDSFELRRNSRIYEYQGNRNPFIDHPELADKIW